MNIIVPTPITGSMIAAGTTVLENDHPEWSAGVTYSVGSLVIRSATHRRYESLANSNTNLTPETNPQAWLDVGPTARFAPFDYYVSTAASATTSLTYILHPGYFNAIALYGLSGSQYSLEIRDSPGGSVIWHRSGYLFEDPAGWYEYLFNTPRTTDRLIFTNLPIRPAAELVVTIEAAEGSPVAVGMIVVGDYISLVGDSKQFGGTRYGVSVEPVTYSYIKTDDYGLTEIVRRRNATNLRAAVVIPRENADQVVTILQGILDVPVACIATTAAGFTGLNVFGLVTSAPVRYDSFNVATIDFTVKGMI